MKVREVTVDVGSGRSEKSANILIPEDKERLLDYIVLRDRITHERKTLKDHGVIITEKLASLLDVQTGDTIYIKSGDEEGIEVQVTDIVENYLMHYVFMSPGLYRELYGKAPEYNKIYGLYAEEQAESEEKFAEEILKQPAVTSILLTSKLQKSLLDMLKSLNIVVYVLIIAAGLLAFVVLYNLNYINISERRRELSTLKVLGFQDTEVAVYVYRENIFLTVFGIALGIFLGLILHRYVILTTEIDIIMFGRNINFSSYLWSILLTFGFTALVNLVMYYQVKRIDMIESLKSVE